MAFEVGCSTITFKAETLPAALGRIRRLGFDVIELGIVGAFCPHYPAYPPSSEKRAETVAAISGSGLRVSAINSFPSLCAADPQDAAQVAAATAEIFALAADLGTAVIVNAGSPKEGIEPCAARLRALHRQARDDFGVALSVEAPHRGSVAETVESAAQLLESTGVADLGIAYDCSHIVNGGSNAVASLALLGERIRQVQARDARDGDIHLTPGDGDFDWDALLAHLSQTGFAGPLTLELEYGDQLNADQIEGEARRARSFLENRMAAGTPSPTTASSGVTGASGAPADG